MTAVGIVAALWLVVAPFLLGFASGGPLWSNLVAAVVAAGLVMYAAAGAQRHYGVALVGVYVVVSSFFFPLTGIALWLNVLAGIVLAVVGYMGSRAEGGSTKAAA